MGKGSLCAYTGGAATASDPPVTDEVIAPPVRRRLPFFASASSFSCRGALRAPAGRLPNIGVRAIRRSPLRPAVHLHSRIVPASKPGRQTRIFPANEKRLAQNPGPALPIWSAGPWETSAHHSGFAYFSNQFVISSRRRARCFGLPERESSWFSPWNRHSRAGTPFSLSAVNSSRPSGSGQR